MPIADLQAKQGKVDLQVEVIEKEEPREFEKFGKKGRVCNAIIKDETGTMKLTLWNEDVDRIHIGDKLNIKNGYVNEWQGEKQLSTGKFGIIEKIEPESENEQDFKEIERENQDLDQLQILENEMQIKENPKDDLTKEFEELEAEKKELNSIEEMSQNKEIEDIEHEFEDLKDKKNKEDAITLDELEEVKIIENKKEPVKETQIPTKDELNEDELTSDLIEEEVIDIDEDKE